MEILKPLSPEWFKLKASEDKYKNIDAETNKIYKEFQNEYSIEKIKSLSGEELLDKIFLGKNKNNLCYKLEFEPTLIEFGCIKGGSSSKYELYFSTKKKSWIFKDKKISKDTAVNFAINIRKKLISGAEIIKNYGEIKDYSDYLNIFEKLKNNELKDNEYLWILKYYHMLFPNSFPPFYSDDWHIHILSNIDRYPKNKEKFLRMGQISCFVKEECNISNITFAKIISDEIGNPQTFFGIEMENDIFDNLKTKDYIAIDCKKLGDLDSLLKEIKEKRISKVKKEKEIKNKISYELKQNNIGDIKTNEIYDFYIQTKEDTCIVAMNREKILGIGRLNGDYFFDENNIYSHCRKVEWLENFDTSQKLKERQRKRKNKNFYKITDDDDIYNLDHLLKLKIINGSEQMNSKTKQPLNQILYGPPGTGKTYSISQYINEIIKENLKNNIENENQKIISIVKDLNWYLVIALSMYINGKNNKYKIKDLRNQKIIKSFIEIKDLKMNPNNILWGELQKHTSQESSTVHTTKRYDPFVFDKAEDSEWFLTKDGIEYVEQNLSKEIEDLNRKNTQKSVSDFYEFITFHQSYSYEKFIEGIKPVIDEEEQDKNIKYKYADGIFKEICLKANSDPNNNYLLIIDEINRGNISKIFGELITLIEEDKRIHPNGEYSFKNIERKNNELLVKLPYSKQSFGVPNNLYIIGTMNTSDRSIASVDIALRRRFKFIEKMPESKWVADFSIGFDKIFENLNNKIRILLDRDHQIGHSYFIKTKYNDDNGNNNLETLTNIWFGEILPLLNEYFYNDWDKLNLIVPGFITEGNVPKSLQNEDYKSYEFRTIDDFKNPEDFKTALLKILE